MKKLILNPKNQKGIIAELIGENGIRIQKRRSDNFPINIFIKGLDYTVVANCTLTGEPVMIECIDGKIQLEDLIIEERKDENDKEEYTHEDEKDTGAGDDAGADKDGAGADGADSGDESNGGAGSGDDAAGGEGES